MESFYTRFRNPLVLIAIVLVQTIALAVQVQKPTEASGGGHSDGAKTMLLRRWIVAAVTPFERLSHSTGLNIRHVWAGYVDLRHAHQQNEALQQEIARLRQEQAEFAEDAVQGRRLQALLDFKQQYITKTVAAQVIGTSGTDRSYMVWIDKGSADGLKPDQPVITPDGVVGRLRDVFPHTSQLLLLSDSTSGAGVVLESTRMRAILRGTASGQVLINNLTADDRIKPGEKVVTSGGDQIFPRGLEIGVIESIAMDPQHQPYTSIRIKPSANLSRLEEVLVITGTDSKLPSAAKQDEDIAEAAAQENKRAADLISERLPSLHESNAGKDENGDNKEQQDITKSTANPAPGATKPRPVLHPDKYSPGTTPSAQELKPGEAATPPPQ